MNIHEHQAKEILKEYGAPVSNGVVIFSIDEIRILNLSVKNSQFLFLFIFLVVLYIIKNFLVLLPCGHW